MLRTLREWFGGAAENRAARRPARARLSVEALDARALPSGNAGAYYFTSDYSVWVHTNTLGKSVDQHHVVDYTAPGGTLYDVHDNGNVIRVGTDDVPSLIGTGASSIASDARGDVFALFWDGSIKEYDTARGWTQVGARATRLVSDAGGNVFALYADGVIWEHNPGTGWSWAQVGATADGLAVDADGNVFATYLDGHLYEHNLGAGSSWGAVGTGYSRLASDPFHNVFALRAADACLYQHSAGAKWTCVEQNVVNLVASSRRVYTLTSNDQLGEFDQSGGLDGELGKRPPISLGEDSYRGLAADASGHVFVQALFWGRVWEVTDDQSPWINTGAYNIESLVGDASGNVFALSSESHQVYQHALGNSTGWSDAGAYNISSLVNDAAGNVFVRSSESKLLYERGATSTSWVNAFSTTNALVKDRTGNVFALSWDGYVYETNLGNSKSPWRAVGSGYSTLTSDETGNVYASTHTERYVHELGAGWSWWSRGPVSQGSYGLTSTGTPPTAHTQYYSLPADGVLNVRAPGLQAADRDADHPVMVTSLRSSTTLGFLTVNADGSFEYIPAHGFVGTDAFTYAENDAHGQSNNGTVWVTVQPNALSADNVTYRVVANQTLTTAAANGLLAHYSDPNGRTATVLPQTARSAHGLLKLNADGTLTYQPNASFRGTDTFTYRVTDGAATSTDGTITLIVGQPPAARNLYYEIPNGTSLNVTAANGLVSVNGDTGGAAHLSGRAPVGLVLRADGSFTFPGTSMVAGNTYTFAYYITNPDGASSIATVTIVVDDPGPLDSTSGLAGGQHLLA